MTEQPNGVPPGGLSLGQVSDRMRLSPFRLKRLVEHGTLGPPDGYLPSTEPWWRAERIDALIALRERTVTAAEAARLLGVQYKTVKGRIKAGLFPAPVGQWGADPLYERDAIMALPRRRPRYRRILRTEGQPAPRTAPPPEEAMLIRQVAAHLQTTVEGVWRLMAAGTLPPPDGQTPTSSVPWWRSATIEQLRRLREATFTAREAADALGITCTTLRQRIMTGRFPPPVGWWGRRQLYDRATVLALRAGAAAQLPLASAPPPPAPSRRPMPRRHRPVPSNNPNELTSQQAAEVLGTTVHRVYALKDAGVLKPLPDRRPLLFDRQAVEALAAIRVPGQRFSVLRHRLAKR